MAVTATQVQNLYLAYFGRPAEPAGLSYWTAQANATVDQISAAFAQQPEYTTTYGGLTRSQTINQLYQNLFGRGAASDELSYWLNSTDVTVDRLALALTNGATGSDRLLLDGKTQYASSITATAAANATVSDVTGAFATPTTDVVINNTPYTSLAAYLTAVTSATSTAAQVSAAQSAYYAAAAVAQTATTAPIFVGAGDAVGNGQTTIGGTSAAASAVNFQSNTAGTITLKGVDTGFVDIAGNSVASVTINGTVDASAALTLTTNDTNTNITGLNVNVSSDSTTAATQLATLNIADLVDLTSVNASGSSAGLIIDTTALTKLATLTTGSGADQLTVSTAASNGVALTVDAGAGADTIIATTGSAALTVNGGAGADKITLNVLGTTSAVSTVNAGDGNDVVTVNAAFSSANAAHTSSITLGAGNDTLVVGTLSNAFAATGFTVDLTTANGISAANASINANLVKVTDFGSSDVLDVTNFAALNLTQAANASGAASLAQAASVAVAAAHANDNAATTTAFQFGGNTYVVTDAAAGGTFGVGDGLIELTGFTGALTQGSNLV